MQDCSRQPSTTHAWSRVVRLVRRTHARTHKIISRYSSLRGECALPMCVLRFPTFLGVRVHWGSGHLNRCRSLIQRSSNSKDLKCRCLLTTPGLWDICVKNTRESNAGSQRHEINHTQAEQLSKSSKQCLSMQFRHASTHARNASTCAHTRAR